MVAMYLGTRFDKREEVKRIIVPPLVAAGHSVTSRWIDEAPGADVLGADSLERNRKLGAEKARECYEDIDRATHVVIFTLWPSSTGGYHVELGRAGARGKTVMVVGPLANVFCAPDEIVHYPTLADFMGVWGKRIAA